MSAIGPCYDMVGKLAAENRVPAIGFGRAFVESGGLLSFGPKEGEAQTAVASIVHSVFQGAKPGEIPVVRQRASWLAVNQKTAEGLGVTISPSVVSRADEVIR
jgi:putative ABC transport system substrate-binding protein